jgi:hypothetical protein
VIVIVTVTTDGAVLNVDEEVTWLIDELAAAELVFELGVMFLTLVFDVELEDVEVVVELVVNVVGFAVDEVEVEESVPELLDFEVVVDFEDVDVEDVDFGAQPPTIDGTALIPLVMGTIFVPQLAACAI